MSQIPDPGDYFAFEIAGQGLFCIRGRDGVIRTFYNVCQHRAHEIVSGDGSCKVLVCPYHAWTYELTGELRSGPNQRAVPGFDRSAIGLTEVRTEILCGFIFVNLDGDAQPMDFWYPGVADELRAFVPDIEKTSTAGVDRNRGKLQLEGLGRELLRVLSLPAQPSDLCEGRDQARDLRHPAPGHCLRHSTECQNLERMTYPIGPDAGPHAEEYSSWYLWPTFSSRSIPATF